MRASWPGLSGSSTETVKMRSRMTSPCWIREAMVITSMFPPERMLTTFLSRNSRCFKAATVRRPEFSTIILWFSTMSRKATMSSLSLMVMMLSTFS